MLKEKVRPLDLASLLLPAEQYRPFPSYSQRDAWDAYPASVRQHFVTMAESMLGQPWEQLTATAYMDFVRNGNRSRYQDVCFGRLKNVFALMMAECLEGKGRFVDDLINGVWVLCEQSTWVVPAHNNHMFKTWENALPDIQPEVVYIDLFAAETGSLLTWVLYFLGEVLDQQTPLVTKRIRHELNQRLIKPFLASDKMGWMGFHLDPQHRVNNWNPWILSNLLPVFALVASPELRAAGIQKTLQAIDHFIDGYAPDGGCDEGPGYWNVAGGSLLDYLEILQGLTGGAVQVFDEPKIRNIAAFVHKAHIAGPYFVNFADASAKAKPAFDLAYRMGKLMSDNDLRDFGAAMFKPEGQNESNGWNLFRTLRRYQVFQEIASIKVAAPLVRDVWLPDLEFAVARCKAGSHEGLYWVAKGGHNDESHNHNDVGHFMVFFDGQPVLVDAGVEVYRAQTFSPQRYEIWTMQSSYHNLPEVNGVQQMAGRSYAAKAVTYIATENQVNLGLDLQAAYPADSGIRRWRREFTYHRSTMQTSLELTEAFDLERPSEIVLHFLAAEAGNQQPGVITLATIQGRAVVLEYDDAVLEASREEIVLTDPQLKNAWERPALYRWNLKSRQKLTKGQLRFQVLAR